MYFTMKKLNGPLVRITPDGVSIDKSLTEFIMSEIPNYVDVAAFVSDWATDEILWFGEPYSPYGEDDEILKLIINYLTDVWKAGHLSIRDVREFTGLDPVDFSRRFNIPYELYMEWERAAKADEGNPCVYADCDNFDFPIYNKWMPQAPCNSNPPRCPRYVVYMLAQLCGMVDILEIPAVQTADKAAENDD